MKSIFLTLCIISYLNWPAYAATITAANCTLSEVQARVNSAVRTVDTVQVPACAPTTWSGVLTISKGITLQGAGMGVTNITATQASPVIRISPDGTMYLNNERLEISGFTLTNNNPSGGGDICIIEAASNTSSVASQIVIHDITFNSNQTGSTQPTAKALRIVGGIYGVAYHITVNGPYMIQTTGASNDGYSDWNAFSYAPGTFKSFVVEDSTWNVKPFSYNEGGQGGGAYTIRYTDINYAPTNNNAAQCASFGGCNGNLFDVHGPQGAGGGQGIEMYGNHIFGNIDWNQSSEQRGGRGKVFFNKNTGSTTIFYNVEELHPTDSGFPAEKVVQSYYWNNYDNSTRQNVSCSGGCTFITENTDYFNQNPSYNGTSQRGIFVGASLPAACTTLDGAWITSQTIGSAMTGMTGRDPSTPISGTLYRCSGGNSWAVFYTPYTYPHPLRGVTPPDTMPPAAPTNLRFAQKE